MEERLDIAVAQKRRFVFARWREVAEQRDGRALIFSVGKQFARDDPEFREVIELSLARKHVEIEHA